MSNIGTMNAEARETAGKGASRSLRRSGRIPAVIYGGEGEPAHVSIEQRAFDKEYQQAGFFSRLYDVEIGGDKVRVLPRDVQLDPVSDVPLHVDFLRYVKGAKITVDVPVQFIGEDVCVGLKRGGVACCSVVCSSAIGGSKPARVHSGTAAYKQNTSLQRLTH